MKIIEQYTKRVSPFCTCIVELLEVRTLALNTYKYVVTINNGAKRERVFSNAAYSIAKEAYLEECARVRHNARK